MLYTRDLRTTTKATSNMGGAIVVLIVTLHLTPLPCRAQSGDLQEDLKNLNVRLKTEHYILAGTVTDTRLEIYAQALEYIHKEYRSTFTDVLKDLEKNDETAADKKAAKESKTKAKAKTKARQKQDIEPDDRTMDQLEDEQRFPVIVFNNKPEYLQFGRAYVGGSEHSIGMYVPSCKLLLIMDQGNFNDTTEVLFHEALHQFMHRYVKNPPLWLNEGLAVYYGTAKPGSSGLSFRNPPAIRWQIVRKCIQKKVALPLWDVVSADHAEFYNPTPIKVPGFENVTMSSLYYSEAYTLVHTLLADPTGRDRLRDYLRDLARDSGVNTPRITRQYFGPDTCEHMTPFWIKHVDSRPETH